MNAMFVKYAGPLTKLMISQTTSRPISVNAMSGIAYEPAVRRARRGAVATLVAIEASRYAPGEAGPPPVQSRLASLPLPDQARLRDERLDGNEVLARLLVDRDGKRIRVAVRPDREVAEHTARDVQPEHGAVDRRPVTTVQTDGLHGDEHRLRAVRCVRVRDRPDRLSKALDERRPEARQRLRRLA